METTRTAKPPWYLFEKRVRSASHAKIVLPFKIEPDCDNTFNKIFSGDPLTPDRAVYVHIPFCNNSCNFCLYNKCDSSDSFKAKVYCQTIAEHIKNVSDKHWVKALPFKAIYFGGGTPTSIESIYLLKILSTLKQHLSFTSDCEITVESTIAEITPELVSRLKKNGVTRMSLGVQTFNEQLRKSIGRRSAPGQIREAIRIIADEGIENICIDLIYNFKEQDLDIWKADLDLISELKINGCSVYPLISKNAEDNLQHEYEYFLHADNTLISLPLWESFSPVQYGHSQKGRAVYVSAHAKWHDILAFGTGSGGRINNYMYFNNSDINRYDNRSEKYNKYLCWTKISPDFIALRNIYLLSESLRIGKSEYEKIGTFFQDIIDEFISKKLVDDFPDRYELTQLGRYWAGNLSVQFSERIRKILENNES